MRQRAGCGVAVTERGHGCAHARVVQVVLGTDKESGKQYAIKMLDKKHIEKQNKIQVCMCVRARMCSR